MKKIDYLKLAIQNKVVNNRSWIISAFSIIKEDPEKYKSDLYYLRLVPQSWGFSFVNDKAELEKIDDAKTGQPLFKFNDIISIDSSWLDSVKSPIETTIGRLIANFICIYQSFGNKYEYINKSFGVTTIEDTISPMLKDTPKTESERSNQYYYVDEYVTFVNSLQFLSTLSQLTAWSATEKGITAPTGIAAFKKQLLIEYKSKLNDPVQLAEFETKLKQFDSEYLKDDPANGTFIKGKVKDTARKKMYLTLGAEEGFKGNLDLVPVINSLEEGWPVEAKQFTAMMNGLRAGSYSRGAETVNGGVSAKTLLRAANNFRIIDTDCGSKLTIKRFFNEKDKNQLINRYVQEGAKTTLVDETNVGTYLGKQLSIRTPLYCKLKGDNICKVCAGLKLFKFPVGISIPITEISSIILTASLKKMHGTVLSTKKLDLTQILS
jgi:hypothetical protein